MKAGILTLYHENRNPGGQLQARALVRAIEAVPDWQAEQLPFAYSGSWMRKSFPERVLKNIAYSGAKKLRGGNTPSAPEIPEELRQALVRRGEAYDTFAAGTPHNTAVFTPETIGQSLTDYDCFICGGDQIWNEFGTGYYYCALDAMSLGFVPETIQKFSYAPSMPNHALNPKFLKKLGANAARLDGLSLREKSSVADLQKVCGRKAQVVADPVLLLTAEQWDREIRVPGEDHYVLCYLLGAGQETREAAKKAAGNLGLPLVTLPHLAGVRQEDMDFGDEQMIDCGPAEFVGLIRDADMVITDSFHAAVFSMIYHRPCAVLPRFSQSGGTTMGSRLTDFLTEYALLGQRFTPDSLGILHGLPEMDFSLADAVREKRRAESLDYLKANLRKK